MKFTPATSREREIVASFSAHSSLSSLTFYHQTSYLPTSIVPTPFAEIMSRFRKEAFYTGHVQREEYSCEVASLCAHAWSLPSFYFSPFFS